MLVLQRDVQYGGAAGGVEPSSPLFLSSRYTICNGGYAGGETLLVAIAHEEVWLELAQVERDLPHCMRAVNHAEDFLAPTQFNKGFERESDPGLTDDGVEDGDLHVQSLPTSGDDGVAELPYDFGMGDGEFVLHLECAQRGRLREVGNGVLDGTVHGVEVDEDIPR